MFLIVDDSIGVVQCKTKIREVTFENGTYSKVADLLKQCATGFDKLLEDIKSGHEEWGGKAAFDKVPEGHLPHIANELEKWLLTFLDKMRTEIEKNTQ